MYDPNRDPSRSSMNAGMGIVSAFAPQGAVGVLAGSIIALVFGLLIGLFEGGWALAAIAGIVVLVPLTARALKREMRREDTPPRPMHPQASSLPADAELPDDERRDAMRRFDDGRET
jgi:integral membrane sensor domain MASE1